MFAIRVSVIRSAFFLVWLIASVAVAPHLALAQTDPLPSWNDGAVKSAITGFVGRVTKEGAADFVAVPERIATFDNDGTLWTEQPFYFQFAFALDRVKAMAPQHPEWKDKQPFKALLEGDKKALAASGKDGLLRIMAVTHTGMTTEDFSKVVLEWTATARHPRFNRPYTELVYQPMLELLAYLRANGFKTFIVSGGGIEFMRPWTERVYGIPPEQVVGSSGEMKFQIGADGKPVLMKLAKIAFVDDGPGKPVGINRFIGRRPIFAFGNSDGDLAMLQWTMAGKGLRFAGLVHHTDAEREYTYDRDSKIGKLDKALDEATAKGWAVVDMKRDWKTVFPGASAAMAISGQEAQAIAKDAYIYPYAMMESYQTWRTQAVDKTANGYVGGFNVFRHYSEPFTPDNKDIVTPNNDAPYSWAWLDLRAEPMVVSVPAVPRDRYYVMQWIDLFTQNFAYIGVRSTGFDAGSYMIAGPNWNGTKPAGIKQVFKAETEIVGTLTRTALQGPDDVANVRAIQAQYKLQPFSAFLKQPAPPAAPAIDFPFYDKAKARTHDFIGYLNFLLQFAQPPVASEVAIRQRFEKIGIGPGKPWDAAKVDPATLAAIDAGVREGQAEIDALAAKTFSTNGLFGSREQLKTNYLQRDVGAMKGLYGNSLEEAWYGGYVCDGSKPSMVHFNKADLPPAKFFWSMTMYTIPDRLLYANPLNRYSIGDRTKGLAYGKDGSLTIYVSNASPGKDKESNWLPAPAAKCSLVARVYGPSQAAMTGAWKLPPLQPELIRRLEIERKRI